VIAEMKGIRDGLFVWDRLRSHRAYEGLDADIAAAERLDLSIATDFEITSALNAVGRGYVLARLFAVPTTTFRARRVDDEVRAKLNANTLSLNDLTAPPADKIKTRGRFNEIGESIRYFGSDPHIAVLECRARPFDEFVVLVTKAKPGPGSAVPFVQFGIAKLPPEPAFLHAMKLGQMPPGGMAGHPKLKKFLREKGIRRPWGQQDAYFNNLATRLFEPGREADGYRLTNALARQMRKEPQAKGSYYPTAQANYCGINIAMPEEDARRVLDPFEAWQVAIGARVDPTGPPGTRRQYWSAVVRRGKFDGSGKIVWGLPGNWSPHDLHIEIAPVPGLTC
jgi:hypothetical protein